MPSLEFFAPCPRGLEAVFADELREIALQTPLTVGAVAPGGVYFTGEPATAMAVNLHSRIASRVLLKIARQSYHNENDVFAFTFEQPWEDWFTAQQTLRVDLTALKTANLRNSNFAALRVKDAICDRLRKMTGARPNIDTLTPDVRVFAFLDATHCTLYLDTTGEALFKRGWRLAKGAAPLRENLAAGILRLSGWTPAVPLYDPMCGSGTFVIEAAQIALGLAPGGERHFAFEKLQSYDRSAWPALKAAAFEARDAARRTRRELNIFGSDISGDMLVKAQANLERAGLHDLWLKQVDARVMAAPTETPGVIIANPPYGERVDVRGSAARARSQDRETHTMRQQRDELFHREQTDEAQEDFFRALGDTLKQRFTGWQAFVLTSDRGLPGQMRLCAAKRTPLFNGPIECRLFRFDLVKGSLRREPRSNQE
ncbi:MAG: putative N6-adenine-specific DNA methylase [Glomeribacter sp. 1016415]|nr:putative N6-adenine-specific DNA methylase [Glomeribacter sp. 1016415]